MGKHQRADLLIELGTEELPPKALKKLARSFASTIGQFLTEQNVIAPANEVLWYATPRRLAVVVESVAARQENRQEQRRGPSVKAAFDDSGAPTRAAMGFAASCGVEVTDLQRLSTDKGEWMVYDQSIDGQSIAELVDEALEQAVKKLPIPRRMRWGQHPQEFVRPVHWLLALFGDEILPVSVLGLTAGSVTRGHRFHVPGSITISSADRYLATLRDQGYVLADFIARQAIIVDQVEALAAEVGARAVIDTDLLDEVTGLVEWPKAIYGEYDRRFLDVPAEVLVSSMRDHQKYFHLVDGDGKLKPGFITVSNIESVEPERVRAGNERVLRARLSDAEFFWISDQKIKLQDRIPALGNVLFHKQLGSVQDKVDRFQVLAKQIAMTIAADEAEVERAGSLCKVDLVTDMVGEFPELQGTVGRYYAANQGEPAEVSDAIEQHYLPRFAGDALPESKVAQSLALADRLDTLCGIFACGEVPSGDKDPYGLRRIALGVLRILVEKNLDLDLHELLTRAMGELQSALPKLDGGEETVTKVYDYVMERLRGYYQQLGFDNEEITAVLAVRPTRPLDLDARLRAVQDFTNQQADAALSLAAANKRIANILSKQDGSISAEVDPTLFRDPAESGLHQKVEALGDEAQSAFARGDYSAGLVALAKLKSPVDTFFDDVMVMDEDVAIRMNRLSLLDSIRQLFLEVADISLIRVE